MSTWLRRLTLLPLDRDPSLTYTHTHTHCTRMCVFENILLLYVKTLKQLTILSVLVTRP